MSIQSSTAAMESRSRSNWTEKYGVRHELRRITDFPEGIIPPKRVRIYARVEHFVLQWWEPGQKTNLCERIEGDLVTAIARARQIDERLEHFRKSGAGKSLRLTHDELVEKFLADLEKRANAQEISVGTHRRYRAALGHYQDYCHQSSVQKSCPRVTGADRAFRLDFSSYLSRKQITPNGHESTQSQPMRGRSFVLDVVRAAYEWAADPERGGLLPDGFRNPFLRSQRATSSVVLDPLKAPDVTTEMAIELVCACDRLQLRLFVPMILFGLRASEPCYLFAQDVDDHWLRVGCRPELHYLVKGRRDKRFPLIEELKPFWDLLRGESGKGLLYVRRAVLEGRTGAPRRDHSLCSLVKELERRTGKSATTTAAERIRQRDRLLREAGALDYDQVHMEFSRLARQLNWPAQATLKDLRHLFATTMAGSTLPEPYRRYLMGHAPGREAIVAYTHLNDLQRHYSNAVRSEWQDLLGAILERTEQIA